MIRVVPKASSYFKNYDKIFKKDKVETCADADETQSMWVETPYHESPSYWEEELVTALKYLKIGKAQFTPNTTNSDVDLFLAKHKYLLND